MSEGWKQLDLEGGGLQRLNMTLAREMKRRPMAYGLLAVFPLGLHRFYLAERIGGLVYLGLSVLALVLAFTLGPGWIIAGLIPALLFAAFDLAWIDRRVTAYNKALRMRRFLKPGNRPPKDYRGRYSDDDAGLDDYVRIKESERAGHQPVDGSADDAGKPRVPSFNEQEAMLRELARTNKGRGRLKKDEG
ncbi:MAG TPA: TM2 domain-containing protein [Thioalkalivibrio sp.]|nr:TM2 domain-containing protein [Thioalkalivibrio sp.]